MLDILTIENIAVIEKVSLSFKNGFTVLTGETGAGKSIIIDSINILLGNRVSKDIIRTGAEFGFVEGMFFIDDKLKQKLQAFDINIDENTIILSREIRLDGRNIIKINDRLSTLSTLKEIASLLLTIHGQHDNQKLLNPDVHITYLDYFGNQQQVLEEYLRLYKQMHQIKSKIKELETDENEKLRKMDLLKYQIDEIEKANLSIEELSELENERKIQMNIEKISNSLQACVHLMYENGENVGGVSILKQILQELSHVKAYDEKLEKVYDSLTEILYTFDDVGFELKDFSERYQYDLERFNFIEERISLINQLKRKYGSEISDILSFLEHAKNELSTIENSDAEINRLNSELQKVKIELAKVADALSEKRKRDAKILEKLVVNELSDLNMPNTKFIVDITKKQDSTNGKPLFGNDGYDRVEFLISANVGEDARPLSKVASGGELSRIMLAIKNILTDDVIPTNIFDEIDTGVSGRTAQKIGEKLYNVSKNKQVLCVTHSAQIASMADNHFVVEKKEENARTKTDVVALSDEKRELEIARIISGVSIDAAAKEHSRKMIKMAEEFKKGI